MQEHYDIFIIGTGVAGTTVAGALAGSGGKIGIVDEREFGREFLPLTRGKFH